jgi:hypothetical protein
MNNPLIKKLNDIKVENLPNKKTNLEDPRKKYSGKIPVVIIGKKNVNTSN